jgi:hypothetical protein
MAKHSRIFVKSGDSLFDFMWADVSADGSVIIGLTQDGDGGIELVLDPELGELRPQDIVAPTSVGALKLSFHATGQYKLTARMGKDQCSLDRATVTGPRLIDILEPRRMAEFLLPAQLPRATKGVSENDIALDVSEAPPPPHRCVVSCMPLERFERHIAGGAPFVDTSEWESTHALVTGSQAWVWTFRKSRNDRETPPRFIAFVHGFPKWGQPSNAGA